MTAAKLERLVKYYGRKRALDEISLEIPSGSVCGLIGPNGSGKTTIMGVLAGLLHVDSGQVDLLGRGPFSASEHAGRITLMPQDCVPSPYTPVMESLTYLAELQGLDRPAAKRAASEALDRVQLGDRGSSKFGSLSHGMRRRFSIAQALLGEPELILLDEPTSGLDPELVVEVRRLILERRGRATLLVSSHILRELEDMCDHAIFVERGQCVRSGPMSEITGRDTVVRFRLTSAPDLSALGGVLPGCALDWVEPVLTVRAPGDHPVERTNADCLRFLLDRGIGIQEVTAGDSLEAAYLASRTSE